MTSKRIVKRHYRQGRLGYHTTPVLCGRVVPNSTATIFPQDVTCIACNQIIIRRIRNADRIA